MERGPLFRMTWSERNLLERWFDWRWKERFSERAKVSWSSCFHGKSGRRCPRNNRFTNTPWRSGFYIVPSHYVFSVIVGRRIKTCWAMPLILWAILTFLCSKPCWLPRAWILGVFCGFKNTQHLKGHILCSLNWAELIICRIPISP